MQNGVAKFGKHSGVNGFTASEEQIKCLDEMTNLVKTIKFKDLQSAMFFQNGIIISNEALEGLFQYLKETFGVNFLITRRLSQDVLENFFGFVRSMGALFTHPDALQFKYRLRLYLLSKHSNTVFSNNTNCEQSDEHEVTFSSEIFHNAFTDNPITAAEVEVENLSFDETEAVAIDLPDSFEANIALLEDFEKKTREVTFF